MDPEYSSSEDEDVQPETDQDRRRVLLESIDKSDLDSMKTSWSELEKELEDFRPRVEPFQCTSFASCSLHEGLRDNRTL